MMITFFLRVAKPFRKTFTELVTVKSKLDGRPPNGQAGNKCSPLRGYGPAELVAASWRSKGSLEHSTK
jgi:hypothetical protein